MSTTSTTTSGSALFNGTSRFSSDFQQVITRAVNIASLPLNQLTNQQNALNSENTELSSLGSKFSSLQSSITALQSATGSASYRASVSDAGIASLSVGSTANAGSYSIEVTSLGSYSTALSDPSTPPVSDPTSKNIDPASSFTLSINGADTTITPASNSLNALVTAINSQSGGSVQASLVNLGSTSAPDYRLSVTSTSLASDTIALTGSAGNLLSSLQTGAPATYKLDGIPTDISSNTRNVTLAPGVTATLLGQSPSGTASSISIARDPNAVGNALSSLVSAYNAAYDAVQNDRGKGTGALNGQSVVFSLGQTLHQLTNYSSQGPGSVHNISDLGLSFDSQGHLSLDYTALAAANTSDVLSFLGNSSSGFLQTASNLLNGVEDSTKGLIAQTGQGLSAQLTSIGNQITSQNDRINILQTTLQAQYAKADALVATLEQQYTQISALFTTSTSTNGA